ncbi:unnamed protein product [Dovyalis caffra]|uniref:DUF868 domain-containing protein n=1 Tax=Dovyalis caffra TaxID=77055 RepID=A0AAV1RF92_9ROSI|nr:unnamed protein product [Dovyalis caffra]
MHDSLGIPACFSFGERQTDEPGAAVTRSGQSVFVSVYRTKLASHCRLITVTWCKNFLMHGLSISFQATTENEHHLCKVELKPWYFWRKQGSKQFIVDGRAVDVVWDLKAAKFNGETEPQSDYYVAIVCEEEVVLLVGDLKKDAYRKTGCRPTLIEPILVSKTEHVFGKKRFTTRVQFMEKGKFHGISIECNNGSGSDSTIIGAPFDTQLEIKVDGQLAILVKHLQWQFRGNESIHVNKSTRVEVYWDVHDWLFGSGPRQGLFIFKPVSSPPSLLLTQEEENCGSVENDNTGGSSSFCLFLHAWKVD